MENLVPRLGRQAVVAVGGSAVSELIALLENLPQLLALSLVEGKGARGRLKVDHIRIDVFCKSRFDLYQTRCVWKIVVGRCIRMPKFSDQLRDLMLQSGNSSRVLVF